MANASRGAPPRRRTPLQALAYWTLVFGVWALIFIAAFLAVFATDLPDTSHLYEVKRQPSITYLDRSGAVVAVRGSQYAPPADLDALPAYVPAAFIAIEDRQFYHHFGFNPWGMARSAVFNLTHPGGPLRGGSTITCNSRATSSSRLTRPTGARLRNWCFRCGWRCTSARSGSSRFTSIG